MGRRATSPANETELIAARYSAGARAYASLWSPVIRPMGERLVRMLPLAGARAVLDIGCGAGALLPEIRARAPGAIVIGVDRSPGMLRIAQEHHAVPLAVMDAQRLALSPESVDVAVMAFMLFHVPDPAQALREARRVLRPGGTLGVITWSSEPSFPAARIWDEELAVLGAPADPSPSVDQDDLMDSPAALNALLADAGFGATRAWVERFEHHWDREQFVAYQLGYGASQRRLATLSLDDRSACVARARTRLAALTADDFVFRPTLVFAIAQR